MGIFGFEPEGVIPDEQVWENDPRVLEMERQMALAILVPLMLLAVVEIPGAPFISAFQLHW